MVSLTVDYIDFNEESRRYTIGVTSIIRVTLRDGVFHEDVGYGMLENSKSKGAALDKVGDSGSCVFGTCSWAPSARRKP